MKNKGTNLFVYSTDPNFNPFETADTEEIIEPAKQDLRITIRKLKGNKKATVIFQFKGSLEILDNLAKHLKNKCGVGGNAKDGEIILQGDCLEKVKTELTVLGYKFKLTGI